MKAEMLFICSASNQDHVAPHAQEVCDSHLHALTLRLLKPMSIRTSESNSCPPRLCYVLLPWVAILPRP